MSDLEGRFISHKLNDDQFHECMAVRDDLLVIAKDWDLHLPESREKSLAMTKLEEAMFWANAAIARN